MKWPAARESCSKQTMSGPSCACLLTAFEDSELRAGAGRSGGADFIRLQLNRSDENAVKQIQGLLRTIKLGFEKRVGSIVPGTHCQLASRACRVDSYDKEARIRRAYRIP